MVRNAILGLAVVAMVMGFGVKAWAGEQTPTVTPDLAAAITKEIQPIEYGDMALVELVTVVNYPYKLQLIEVQTTKGKAPITYGENLGAQNCPTGTIGTGLKCRQRWTLLYSFNTCQFNHNTALKLRYTAPGLPDVTIPFSNNSNNWCDETTVSVPAPVITSFSPGSIKRGQAFDLYIVGNNFTMGDPVVRIGGVNYTPNGTVSNTMIQLKIPANMLTGYGPVLVQVLTGGGTSNPIYLWLPLY